MSSILLRWGGLAAMVAGVLWIIFGVLNAQPLGTSHTTAPFAVRDPSLYRIYHLPAALATLLAAIGLLGLGRRLAQPANLPARVGSILAYIAAAAGAVNTLALAALVISLHFARAMIGVFSLGIGTILVGAAALRNAGWRRWQALPLTVGILGVLVFPPLHAHLRGTGGVGRSGAHSPIRLRLGGHRLRALVGWCRGAASIVGRTSRKPQLSWSFTEVSRSNSTASLM